MNKELTPLEAFEKILDMAHESNGYQNFTNACDAPYTKIVKNALEACEIDCNDYKLEEALVNLERNSKRYKGRKEDLDTLFNVVKGYQYQKKKIVSLIEENKTLNKEHKAFDVIKKYPKVPLQRLINYEKAKAKGYDVGTLEENDIPYTQEEYELLKELL